MIRAGLAFGGLLFVAPLLCAGTSTLAIPNSVIATLLGLAMLPVSAAIALFAWQGSSLDDFLRDAFRLLLLQRIDGLRGGYYDGTPLSRVGRDLQIPSAAALLPVPAFVCGVAGFIAAIFSHLPLALTVLAFSVLGLLYGIALYGVLWFEVLPLLVAARRGWPGVDPMGAGDDQTQ